MENNKCPKCGGDDVHLPDCSDFYNQLKDFNEKLAGIIDMLATCGGRYTDTEYKDVRVYDRLEKLINDEANDSVKVNLKLAQDKINEAYLWLKDLVYWLSVLD